MRSLRAVVALLAVAWAVGTPGIAIAEPSMPGEGFDEISGCVSQADRLLVSVMVDESASLRTSDPSADRVQGVASALRSMQDLAREASGGLITEVRIGTFARGVSVLADWAEVTPANVVELTERVASTLPSRNAGDATDYRQALNEARTAMLDRAEQVGDTEACKVLMLFTDGALDVDEQTDQAARDLCRPGGIADSLRKDGISTVAVALFNDGSGVTPEQQNFLQALATGSAGGQSCGTLPLLDEEASGAYLLASKPAALAALFAGAGALVGGGQVGVSAQCPQDCPGDRLEIPLDAGLASVTVLVYGGEPSLTAPDGTPIDFDGTEELSVARTLVSASADAGLTRISLRTKGQTRDSGGWVLSNLGGASVEAYYFWGATITGAIGEAVVGEPLPFDLQLENADGSRVDPSDFGDLTVTLESDADTTVSVSPTGGVVGELLVPSSRSAATIEVTLRVMGSTRRHAIPVGPLVLRQDVAASLPPTFPTVSPSGFSFGRIENTVPAEAQIRLTGAEGGSSTVCLQAAQMTVRGERDQTAADWSVTDDQECLTLEPGEGREMLVEWRPPRDSVGAVHGAVVLDLLSDETGETVEFSIPFDAELIRPVDQARRVELTAILLLGALVVPLLLNFAANHLLLGRFRLQRGSRIGSVSGCLTSEGVLEVSGTDACISPEDLSNISLSRDRLSSRLSIPDSPLQFRSSGAWRLSGPRGVVRLPTGASVIARGWGSSVLVDQPGRDLRVDIGIVRGGFAIVRPDATSDSWHVDIYLLLAREDGLRAATAALRTLTTWRGWTEVATSLRESAAGDEATAKNKASFSTSQPPETAFTPPPPTRPGGVNRAPESRAFDESIPPSPRASTRRSLPSQSPPSAGGPAETGRHNDDGLPPPPRRS
ncbi:MAG: VWA domain-containing protein [Actinobacteria bacterium]|nr:VWA domain-containing protein [Actinomycetota bacterium]